MCWFECKSISKPFLFLSFISHTHTDTNIHKCIERYKAALVSDAHQTRCSSVLIKGSWVLKQSLAVVHFHLCLNENLVIISRDQSTKMLSFHLAQTLYNPKPCLGSFLDCETAWEPFKYFSFSFSECGTGARLQFLNFLI